MKRRLLATALGMAACLAAASPALGDDSPGEAIYQGKCQSCHGEEGEGRGSFPTLDGNPNLSDRGFVEDTLKNGRPGMPAYAALPEADFNHLVDYLVEEFGGGAGRPAAAGSQSGAVGDGPNGAAGQSGGSQTGGTAAPAAPLPPGDAGRGEEYFLGKARLANGGAACVGCHRAGNAGGIGGGSLAIDLTQVSQRFGGEAGVAGALQNPAFPVMVSSYQNKDLTDAERADLAAFFTAVAADRSAARGFLPGAFWLVSLAGTALLFVLMGLFWPRRGTSPAQRIRKSL